jgi:endogenous inhibitor of DNA gyrase (YacG/DUF329 family)
MDLNNMNSDMEVGVPFEEYEKPSNSFRPPEPGTYSFLRSTEKELEWKPTDNGNIWTGVRYLIQGGDFSNRSVFSTLSTYVGKYRKASSVQDFLAACGNDSPPSNGSRFTVQEIQDNVAQTFGPFDAYIDWQVYCPDCEETVFKNSKSLPKDADGKPIHEVECPKCQAKLTAKANVKRYIVK